VSGWLVGNTGRVVGDGSSTLFWKDPWKEGVPFFVRFRRLYELAENKMVSVSEMFNLECGGWRLFAWEEEGVELLTTDSMQVGVEDRWIWKLHSSTCYAVSNAYHSLTDGCWT
jgi:hypothetical protein